MKLYKNESSSVVKNSIFISIALMFLAIIIKTIHLSGYFNISTGLLDKSSVSIVFNVIFFVCILLIVLINIRVAVEVTPLTRYYKLGTPVFVGYVLFASALLFLIQGITDISGHIMALIDYKTAFGEFLTQQQSVVPFVAFYFPMAVDIACLISAISFYVLGMEYVREDEKKHLLLYLIPVVWSILVVVNILIAVPETVSFHDDGSKILLGVMMIGFLYYLSYWACGFEPVKKTLFSMCIRFIFPFVTTALSVPFLISTRLGVKDTVANVPYFSVLGLAIYGFIIMIQFVTASVHVINKNTKIKNGI